MMLVMNKWCCTILINFFVIFVILGYFLFEIIHILVIHFVYNLNNNNVV